MSLKHMGVRLISVANKIQCLWRLWALSNDSKHNEVSFSKVSTDLLWLWIAHIHKCWDLAIFVLTNRRTEPIALPLSVHVRGVIIILQISMYMAWHGMAWHGMAKFHHIQTNPTILSLVFIVAVSHCDPWWTTLLCCMYMYSPTSIIRTLDYPNSRSKENAGSKYTLWPRDPIAHAQ